MQFKGWFVKLTSTEGILELPVGSAVGYRTKREAESVAQKARTVEGILTAEVVKYDK